MTSGSYMYHKKLGESKPANGNESMGLLLSRMRGFTLLELLVVMVIIGVLAGYVGPRYFSQIGKSEVNAAKAQIDALEKALDSYRLDIGTYPTNELGLQALMQAPPNQTKWAGPYLKKALPADPWGRPYLYRLGDNGAY